MSTIYVYDSYFRVKISAITNIQFRMGYDINGTSTAFPGNGFGIRFDTTLKDITAATYTSGGTVTGSSTQTCNAAFVGGTATATIALTGTNTIAGSTAFTAIAGGIGYNSTNPPTQAVLTSGTATCSGTATISATLGSAGSGADTNFAFVSSASGSPETMVATATAPVANTYVKFRIRLLSTSTRAVEFTLYNASGTLTDGPFTICGSGCTATLATTTSGLVPAGNIVTATSGTESFTWDYWKFRAFGLSR
jgi:hypothetical protein